MKNLNYKPLTQVLYGIKKILLVAFSTVAFSCTTETDSQMEETPEENPTSSSAFSVGIAKSFAGAATLNYADANAVADFYAGEHPVAIYSTPSGKESDIGIGKLILSRNGAIYTMKLLNASGTVLAENAVDINANGGNNYKQFIRSPGGVQITTITTWANTSDHKRQQILILTNDSGELYDGYTSLEFMNQYHFRNNVEHFGTTPPEAFASLKGVWEGPSFQPTCNSNPVTVTIASDGSVTFTGKSSLTCTAQNATLKWDGLGDFVRPNTTDFSQQEKGSMIALDYEKTIGSTFNNGNRPGALIVVPKLKDPTTIIDAQYYPSPSQAGFVIVKKPTKK